MGSIHDKIKKRQKKVDIDMNELLDIKDPRWIFVCDKVEDCYLESKDIIDFISKVSALDLDPKEMFLVGFVTADFLNKL